MSVKSSFFPVFPAIEGGSILRASDCHWGDAPKPTQGAPRYFAQAAGIAGVASVSLAPTGGAPKQYLAALISIKDQTNGLALVTIEYVNQNGDALTYDFECTNGVYLWAPVTPESNNSRRVLSTFSLDAPDTPPTLDVTVSGLTPYSAVVVETILPGDPLAEAYRGMTKLLGGI